MQKQVTWPAPLEIKPGEITRTAPKLLLEMVMNQPYWRESFERIDLGDAICEILEKDEPKSLFTPGQREALIGGMKLDGNQITPALVNRYYLKVMRAVHQAEDIREEKNG